MSIETRIGIIGGGQLGGMMVPEAKKLGFNVTVLDPTEGCPAHLVGAAQVVGGLKDPVAIRNLAARSDFLTVEIEHVGTETLHQLVKEEKKVNPSPTTLDLIRDKYMQKVALKRAGVPTADFEQIRDFQDLEDMARIFQYPFMLKSRFGAYDGRGNFKVRDETDLETAFTKLGEKDLYVERHVPFDHELALMIARGFAGDIVTYPVVKTIHKNNICDTVEMPAPIHISTKIQAEVLAKKALDVLDGAGIFGIEMFLVGRKLLVNEIAPRPHNSGHYTMEACSVNQFEQHIRAVTGMRLALPSFYYEAAVMKNILGEGTGPVNTGPIHLGERNKAMTEVLGLHVYGKTEVKVDRKMGHITATGPDINVARIQAEAARRAIKFGLGI